LDDVGIGGQLIFDKFIPSYEYSGIITAVG
jgi:hypothetical protein